MGTRQALHQELLNLAPHAYYQPPSSEKMSYPCFVYDISSGKTFYADNNTYKHHKSYTVTYVTTRPADSIIDLVLEVFSYCRFDRHYIADNLHHYTFSLFY